MTISSRPTTAPAGPDVIEVTHDYTVDPATLEVRKNGQLILAKPADDAVTIYDLMMLFRKLGHAINYTEVHW